MATFGERFALNNGIMTIIPYHYKTMVILPPINFPPFLEDQFGEPHVGSSGRMGCFVANQTV